MTSNNPFSAFDQFNRMYCDFSYIESSKKIIVVEYARRGGIYNHHDGRLSDNLQHSYIAGMEIIKFRLHVGDQMDPCGFPARHELVEFTLMNEGWNPPTFETAADGSIGIMHGFRRDGWPVDIIFHGISR